MIYGQKYKNVETGTELLEIKELIFDAPANVLLDIAMFLHKMGVIIEKEDFKTNHYHIDSVIKHWHWHPFDKNIVVLLPVEFENPFDKLTSDYIEKNDIVAFKINYEKRGDTIENEPPFLIYGYSLNDNENQDSCK